MSVTFNANEVFEMAEEIERNGARFYRETADRTGSDVMKDMFLSMAAMEDQHLETFEEMRKGLDDEEKGGTAFDPFNEASLYLQSMADSRGSEGMRSPTEKLTGDESPEDLLEIAIGAEKNSVLFYVGLKDMVSSKAGRDKVEAIIREEVRHVADLRRQLVVLQGK
jgi:rubrerythrin